MIFWRILHVLASRLLAFSQGSRTHACTCVGFNTPTIHQYICMQIRPLPHPGTQHLAFTLAKQYHSAPIVACKMVTAAARPHKDSSVSRSVPLPWRCSMCRTTSPLTSSSHTSDLSAAALSVPTSTVATFTGTFRGKCGNHAAKVGQKQTPARDDLAGLLASCCSAVRKAMPLRTQ